jgi:hypothetical protein
MDRNGIRKERPCIVMTPTARISREQPLLVVAVTTTFADPPPEWHVALPWHPDPAGGHWPGTPKCVRGGLARYDRVDDVLDVKGSVPPAVMRRIEALQEQWATEMRGED